MAMNKCSLLAMLLLVFSIIWPSTCAFRGDAGFTDAPLYPACGTATRDEYFAAVADSIYRKGKGCGSKYKITCVDTSEYSCISKVPVVVTVVDSCQPEGNENCPTFVLSEKVFASIADIDRGIVQVTYQLVY